MSVFTRTQKIVFVFIGLIPLVIGAVLLGTAGIKGFNGTGGEDTALFQLMAYVSGAVIVGGLLVLLVVVRPNRMLALVSGLILIVSGAFLLLLQPLIGVLVLIPGLVAITIRGRIPKT